MTEGGSNKASIDRIFDNFKDDPPGYDIINLLYPVKAAAESGGT